MTQAQLEWGLFEDCEQMPILRQNSQQLLFLSDSSFSYLVDIENSRFGGTFVEHKILYETSFLA